LSFWANFGLNSEIWPFQKALRFFLKHQFEERFIFLETYWHPLKTHFPMFCIGGLVWEKKAKKWQKTSILDHLLTRVVLLE